MLLLLPDQLHFGLNGEYSKHIYRQVVGGSKVGVQRLQGAVLARHRLRAVLGPEDESVLDDHIRRGQFLSHLAWQAIQESKPATEEVGGRESVLELWPIGRQVLGVPNFGDWLTLLRDTVNAAWEPIARDELVEVLREDKGYMQTPANLRGMLRLVKHLGFVREEGGSYTVEEDPAEELMAEATPDVLVEALLVRVYGFARALHILESGIPSPQLVQRLRDDGLHRPAAYSVVARLRELDLVDESGETMALSANGKRWAARLPETLPVREAKLVVVETSPAKPSREWPSFEQIAKAFETDPALQGFVFPRSQLLELYTAWHFHPRKRFVLLSGLSGTGKTALTLGAAGRQDQGHHDAFALLH
jgi:5-methylcytosine-specific restriction protein B